MRPTKPSPILLILTLISFSILFVSPALQAQAPEGKFAASRKQITADHSRFEALNKSFRSGDEVTKACLGCHNQASEQVKRTFHWQWHIDGQENFGKGGLVVNNYCISSNKLGDKSCNDCHIGWNAKDGEVNCLVCHSQKEMNWKESFDDLKELEGDDAADEEIKELIDGINRDLHASITAIGQPGPTNCGSCHFYSGGGDGVKRGDMSSSMGDPPRELDVHLSRAGAGLSCVDCHNTRNHEVPGRHYSQSAGKEAARAGQRKFESNLACESCHSSTPHREAVLNTHYDFLACQTCHIPLMARKDPTKMWWDWSKAGQLKDGKKFDTKDEFHQKNYMSIKGEFRWEKNVIPHYAWYDGSMKNLTLNDPVTPGSIVDLQIPNGAPGDGRSKIYPFKVHSGNQPYDTKLNRLLAPMLSGEDGYWETLDWLRAFRVGMEKMGLPFSGEYGFIQSRFMYPLHHSVAPKEMALNCDDCHNRSGNGSRMAEVPGVYVAGRGDLIWITRLAWIFVGIVVLVSILHAGLRIGLKLRRK